MRFSNRLNSIFAPSILQFERKWSFVHKNFSTMLCLLLLGFIIGSMFGSIVNTIPRHLIWDWCVGVTSFGALFGLMLFMEIISYLTYRTKHRSFLFISSQKLEPMFWRFANMFKIGLMLGFFVDAFKVGS